MTNPVPGRSPYLWIAGVVVALDQVTKALVDDFMALHESRPIVEGLVRLTYVQNRGAAFGILSEADLPYQSVLFSVVSLLAAARASRLYAWRLPVQSRLPQTALALVMGGAVGNLIDRARLGYVIDFVDVYWGPHHWPAFNVADSAITVGVALLVLDILRNPQPGRAPKAEIAASARRTRRVASRCTRKLLTLPAFELLGRNIGPLTLHTYGVLLAIAFLTGLWVASRQAKAAGLDAAPRHRHGRLRPHRGPDRGQGPARRSSSGTTTRATRASCSRSCRAAASSTAASSGPSRWPGGTRASTGCRPGAPRTCSRPRSPSARPSAASAASSPAAATAGPRTCPGR